MLTDTMYSLISPSIVVWWWYDWAAYSSFFNTLHWHVSRSWMAHSCFVQQLIIPTVFTSLRTAALCDRNVWLFMIVFGLGVVPDISNLVRESEYVYHLRIWFWCIHIAGIHQRSSIISHTGGYSYPSMWRKGLTIPNRDLWVRMTFLIILCSHDLYLLSTIGVGAYSVVPVARVH